MNRPNGLLFAVAFISGTVAITAQQAARTTDPSIATRSVAGKILTVKGPIHPDEIGATLMHEHLFIDQTVPGESPERWKATGRTKPVGATEVELYNSSLRMELLGAVVMGAPNRDNWLLIDEKLAIEEVNEFKEYGGDTLVDVTSIGLKRDPQALRRVSEATGLHFVMGSSWYGKGWYGDEMDERSVESLTEEIVRDITIGVGNTGICSGIIGEVGIGKGPLTPNEQKVIRASGRASHMTGAAVTLRCEAVLEKKLEILDLLVAEGADLSRVIIGQSNLIAPDMPFMKQLLDRGVYLQFDRLGRQPSVRTIVSDTDVAAAIVDLIEAGYIDRILLSQGVDTKVQLKAYGGTGYAFISRYYVPYLKRIGVTDTQIHTIWVENPKRILAFAPPHTGTSGDSGR